MSNGYDDFFQGTGPGAPSFKFENIGDQVWGDIADISRSQSTVYSTNPNAPKVLETKDDGSPRMQLRIIIATQLRNWQGVSKVPTYEQGHAQAGQPKNPAEDDGKRAVFIKENSNLQYRLGDALLAAGGGTARAQLGIGGKLAVTFASTRPSNQGNDAKQYDVHYQPPTAAAGFFEAPQGQPQQQATPVQQGYASTQNQPPMNQQAYVSPPQQPQFQQPQQQPVYQQAPPPQQQPQYAPPPPAQQDPWAQPQGQPQQQAAAPQQQQGFPPQGAPVQQDPWNSGGQPGF